MSSSSAGRSSAELAALVEQLRTADTGLRGVINAQAAQLEAQGEQLSAQAAQLRAQAEQIVELQRRLSKDSATSSKPPSSDSPYRKPAPRSSRQSSGRKPGKQPGAPGTTMPLVDDPDEVVIIDPPSCTGCGTDLADAPVRGVERRQLTDVRPPPPPWVTEYQIFTRVCPGCAGATCAPAPVAAPARARYGPAVPARAAELTCAHYLPVTRAAALMRSLLGVTTSTGFIAGRTGW